jgi:hypothetical protein
MPTLDDLRMMPPDELRPLAETDEQAAGVLAGRQVAADQLRLVAARAYGLDGNISTPRAWSRLPYLTDVGAVGIVDIAQGMAWDTGVTAVAEVADLGLHDPGKAYAAAAMAPGAAAATVRFDGVPVQHAGTAVVDGQVIPPSAPAGWRQILLGFQGYGGSLNDLTVPTAMFAPATWIRPRLVAAGLMTCYGTPGEAVPEPGEDEDGRPNLAPDGQPWLYLAYGGESAWPHGLPAWVHGRSVTVLDRLVDEHHSYGEYAWHPRRTRLARGEEQVERDRIRIVVTLARAEIAAGRWPEVKARDRDRPRWQHDNAVRALDRAEEALASRDPGAAWDAADALARGRVIEAVHPLWDMLTGPRTTR